MSPLAKPLLDVVRGKRQARPPIWIMRQAGRYLPEYRQIRAGVGSFLELCYTPELATEVTLQPLRRFDLDAAILFSDILVIPDALGQTVSFETGEGPRLEPIGPDGLGKLRPDAFLDHLAPVLETVGRVKENLASDKTLIGFCGSPWTVATYMIAGHGTPDQAPARIFGYRAPEAMRRLLAILADRSAEYLKRQIACGADVVQIFDSWAGVLDEASFEAFCVEPVRRIVDSVRREYPDVPIIGFPKGAGEKLGAYARETGVDAIGVDETIDPLWAARELPAGMPVQGNLDPLLLLAGGEELDRQALRVLEAFADRPEAD